MDDYYSQVCTVAHCSFSYLSFFFLHDVRIYNEVVLLFLFKKSRFTKTRKSP